MPPAIIMLIVFLGIVLVAGAIWMMNQHLNSSAEAEARAARARVIYFVRWVTPEQIVSMRRRKLTFTEGNLGLIRRAQIDAEEEKARSLANAEAIAYNKRWRWLRGPDRALIEAPVKPDHILDADENGIVFDSSNQQTVLRQLGWQIAASVDTNIQTDNGRYVELVTYIHDSTVNTRHYPMRSWVRFRDDGRFGAITATFINGPLLVETSLYSGSYVPADDGTFYIVINGSAIAGENVEAPEKIWGMTLPPQRQAFRPSGLGTVVLSPEGYAIAELVGNCLYIHHNLFGCPDLEHALGLYTRILQKLQPELNMQKALERLVDRTWATSGLQDVVTPTLLNGSTKLIGVNENERRAYLFTFLTHKLLLPVVDKNVIVWHAGGAAVQPNPADPPFRIILWSSPTGACNEAPPATLFGLPVTHQDPAFALTGRGLPLFDSAGYIIGELFDNCLYVHFDPVRVGSYSEAVIFARLLMALADALVLRRLSAEEQQLRSSLQFVKTCIGAVEAVASQPAIDARQLAQTQAELHDMIRHTANEEASLLQLEAAPEGELGLEFDRLLSLASVLDVKVTEHKLVVTTDVLYCRDPRSGKLHEIGAFDITIPSDGAGEVEWNNRTRKVSGYQAGMNAPHVFSNGRACLGNVKDLFPKLIAKRDFASAVLVAIAFVESVNVDDAAGKHVHEWPLARR